MSARVVITGMSGLTSLGSDWESISKRVRGQQSGIRKMQEWTMYDGLNTLLGGPISDFEVPGHYTRKRIRSMGRVALFSTVTTERALEQAGLLDDPVISSGETGIAYGSSSGTPGAIADFAAMLHEHSTSKINATSYIRMMSHVVPSVNC